MTEQYADFEFDVALSFAGEDRGYVEDVAADLADHGVRIFYDEYSAAESWGRDLYVFLDEVYRKKARFAVVFVSRHYVSKPWPTHERQSAQARALTELEPYLLPIRLDDSEVPGLRPTVGYVDARRVSKQHLVELVMKKLGQLPVKAVEQAVSVGVPRTSDEKSRLRVEQPRGWEYLLFASVLADGKEALEAKWRDHELGYVRPSGRRLTDPEAVELLTTATSEVMEYIKNLERALDPRFQELAFGRPGEPGDPDRIEHLAGRTIIVYEDLLDWAARLRSAQVSERFRRAVQLVASLVDLPLKQVRTFVDRCVAEFDRIPALLAAPDRERININLTLKLDIDPATSHAFQREMDRLRRSGGR